MPKLFLKYFLNILTKHMNFFIRNEGPVLVGSFLNFLAILLSKVSYMFLKFSGNEFFKLASKVEQALHSHSEHNKKLHFNDKKGTEILFPRLTTC